MALFDEYANDPRERRSNCCDMLAGMPRLDQFLHVLGHSRVPFALETLVAIAEVPPAHVTAGIAKAIDAGWIGVVEPEEYMDEPTGLYVGQLNKRR